MADGVDRVLFLLVCVLGLIPALIRVRRGRTARSAPLKIAGDAIPTLSIPVLLFALVVPFPGAVRIALSAIGVLLLVWDTVNDVRSWRRSKAPRLLSFSPREASPPSPRGAGRGSG